MAGPRGGYRARLLVPFDARVPTTFKAGSRASWDMPSFVIRRASRRRRFRSCFARTASLWASEILWTSAAWVSSRSGR